MNNLLKKSALAISPLAVAAILFGSTAFAAPITPSPSATPSATPSAQPFSLVPGVFDPSNQCPGIYSNWDNTTGNPAPSIKLIKPCPTSTIAAPYVDVYTGLEGGLLSAITELNFDYMNGGHCGAGAPRFNLVTDQGIAFLGCAGGTQTPIANTNYTHVVFTPAQLAAAYTAAGISNPSTAILQDIYIIFDEGIDTPSGGNIGTPGIVNIDNISINNSVVGSPANSPSPSPSTMGKDACKDAGYKVFQGQNGQPGPFRNQGDCVSYFSTGGRNTPNPR
jgi:hypothetical protein